MRAGSSEEMQHEPMSALVERLPAEVALEFGAEGVALVAVLDALKTSAKCLDAAEEGARRLEDVARFAAQIDQLEALLDLLSVTGDRR
jgi:hypothetical protein